MSDRIDDIRKRLDAATPGPWRRVNPCNGPGKCRGCDEYGHGAQDYIDAVNKRSEYAPEIITCDSGVYGPNFADAEFITHAPGDIAYLLRLVGEYEDQMRRVYDDANGNAFIAAARERAKGE